MISRRDALKRLGAFAGAAAAAPHFLTGCDDPDEAGITHIVVVCMENRSYDHYLGARAFEGKPGEGLTTSMANPRLDDSSVSVFKADVPCVFDPPHGWTAAHAQYAEGAMNGFLREYEEDSSEGMVPHVMGYFERGDLPIHYSLADAYTTCDHWFAGLLGPTWPNRLFLYAGESGGMISNDRLAVSELRLDTVLHRLKARGIGYRYYFGDLPFAALIHGLDPAFNRPMNFEFFDDAEHGRLQPVTFIDPGFGLNDDHPPHHPILGQQFLASVYSALAASPHWKNLLMVVTYDENGGFFDHVAPPTIADQRAADGFDRLGFRVPTHIIGPYVKQGYVSPVVYNHASIVRHIETMFGLEPHNVRVAASPDLSDAIDLPRLADGDWRPAAMLPAVMVDQSQITAECYGGPFKEPEPTDIEKVADTGYFGKLDRRKYRMDDLKAIASVLERHRTGGIRRGW